MARDHSTKALLVLVVGLLVLDLFIRLAPPAVAQQPSAASVVALQPIGNGHYGPAVVVVGQRAYVVHFNPMATQPLRTVGSTVLQNVP